MNFALIKQGDRSQKGEVVTRKSQENLGRSYNVQSSNDLLSRMEGDSTRCPSERKFSRN